MSKPDINVTPLIDVLLVLLIIFLIAAPPKPAKFKTEIPQEPKDNKGVTNPHTLVVALSPDSTLRLNNEQDMGTAADPARLIEKLQKTFLERTENNVFSAEKILITNIPDTEKVEKTVFIKAPQSIDYGSVAKVLDAVKSAGANPIALQIDRLED